MSKKNRLTIPRPNLTGSVRGRANGRTGKTGTSSVGGAKGAKGNGIGLKGGFLRDAVQGHRQAESDRQELARQQAEQAQWAAEDAAEAELYRQQSALGEGADQALLPAPAVDHSRAPTIINQAPAGRAAVRVTPKPVAPKKAPAPVAKPMAVATPKKVVKTVAVPKPKPVSARVTHR